MLVIGVDPDSKANALAFYREESLVDLKSWTLPALMSYLQGITEEVVFSIEDVCSNKFIYTRNRKINPAIQSKLARNVGMCQQAQIELMRFLDHHEIRYTLHKPQQGNWAKDTALFKRITGWKGLSNEDTRSAAYFGFLEAGKHGNH